MSITERRQGASTQLCECGCGQPTAIATKNWKARGYVKGEPVRFIPGHVGKTRQVSLDDYDERPGPLDTPCWIIRKVPTGQGYVQIRIDGRQVLAHRASYEKHVGPITEETLDHLCKTPQCINPAHLEPCSRAENTLRGDTITAANKAKTRCHRGHLLSGDNLIVGSNKGRPSRACRACAEASRARKRSARAGSWAA